MQFSISMNGINIDIRPIIKIKMSNIQSWHDVVMNIQNANLDKQNIQQNITRLNKWAYKEQLDRGVQLKNKSHTYQNSLKITELQQAKRLAQVQKLAKLRQKKLKQQVQKRYEQENLNMLNLSKNIKTVSQEIERKNVQSFIQHPFIRLIDAQDTRNQQLRKKFIKQNQINCFQQQMKHQQVNTQRYQQVQDGNNFIDYIERSHEKRSQQRERFKNKYLKIKKGQLHPNSIQLIGNDISVQKMYVNFLNNQIQNQSLRRMKQKKDEIDDQRISKFYLKSPQPDSSPAYLGRNPLNYQRRRQLYYINEHLTNPTKETSLTSKFQLDSNSHKKSMQYAKLVEQLNSYSNNNPQEKRHQTNKKNNSLFSQSYQNHSQSVQIRPFLNSQKKSYQNQVSTHRKYDSMERRQPKQEIQKIPILNYNYIYGDHPKHNTKLAQDSNRRIRSQQVAVSERKQLKKQSKQQLPSISNHNLNKANLQKKQKKQYMRYDVITGKSVSFYV